MGTNDYIVKIGDFGISINLNMPSSKAQYHCSGDPIYIAPELMSFNRTLTKDINAKTDIFSVGIMLLELLCDIKAPSQGKIFQNLRKNKIDFPAIEPSPICNKKFTKKRAKERGFDFKQIIKKEIDLKIKDLCKWMLQKKSHLRPNCNEIICKIQQLLTDKKYMKFFAECSGLNELLLPRENILNKNGSEDKNSASHNVSLSLNASNEKKSNE